MKWEHGKTCEQTWSIECGFTSSKDCIQTGWKDKNSIPYNQIGENYKINTDYLQ